MCSFAHFIVLRHTLKEFICQSSLCCISDAAKLLVYNFKLIFIIFFLADKKDVGLDKLEIFNVLTLLVGSASGR